MSELSAAPPSNPFAAAPIAAAPQGSSGQAQAIREVAEVQAALLSAKKFPRDERAAFDRVLTACGRTRLAESAAYEYARGGQAITGPSIRLAEVLLVSWGNMIAGVTELSRWNGVSECLAYAWDLETNARDEKRFHVRHVRDTRKGTYPVTDERDIYELVANSGARRKRACILALIPGDLQDAALDQCEATLKAEVDVTPERIKSMVEAFGKIGVSRDAIERRIQRRVDTITPGLMLQLRRIYTSIEDGMSEPSAWFTSDPSADGESAKKTTAEVAMEHLRGQTTAGAVDAGGAGSASPAGEQSGLSGPATRAEGMARGTSDPGQGSEEAPAAPVHGSADPHGSALPGASVDVPEEAPAPSHGAPAETADPSRALTAEQIARLDAAKARRRSREGGEA